MQRTRGVSHFLDVAVTALWFPQGGPAWADVSVPSSSYSGSRTGRSVASSEPRPRSSLLWRWEGGEVSTVCVGRREPGPLPCCDRAGQPRVSVRLVWRCRGQGTAILLVTKSGVYLVVVLRRHSHPFIAKEGRAFIEISPQS